DRIATLAYIDRGRLQTNAYFVVDAIERAIVKGGEYDVIHGVTGRDVRNERTHQQPRQRRIAVGGMINVRLTPFRMIVGWKIKSGEAGIAEAAQIERGNCIAAQSEKSERTALKAVRHLVAAAADVDQIIPIARRLEYLNFFVC